jgi:hypothetical protein
MESATSPTLTGNPGQPRDLQFRGPLLGMFSTGIMGLQPTQRDEKRLKGTAFRECVRTRIIQPRKGRPELSPGRQSWDWSFYIFGGDVDDISTKAAPLDAVFWLVSGHDFSRAITSERELGFSPCLLLPGKEENPSKSPDLCWASTARLVVPL